MKLRYIFLLCCALSSTVHYAQTADPLNDDMLALFDQELDDTIDITRTRDQQLCNEIATMQTHEQQSYMQQKLVSLGTTLFVKYIALKKVMRSYSQRVWQTLSNAFKACASWLGLRA